MTEHEVNQLDALTSRVMEHSKLLMSNTSIVSSLETKVTMMSDALVHMPTNEKCELESMRIKWLEDVRTRETAVKSSLGQEVMKYVITLGIGLILVLAYHGLIGQQQQGNQTNYNQQPSIARPLTVPNAGTVTK